MVGKIARVPLPYVWKHEALDFATSDLALQLSFCFEVSALSGSLVSPSPE